MTKKNTKDTKHKKLEGQFDTSTSTSTSNSTSTSTNSSSTTTWEKAGEIIDRGVIPSPKPPDSIEIGFVKDDYLPSYIPLDRKRHLQYLEVFNRRITPSFTKTETKDEEGKEISTYTTKTSGGELSFRFLQDIIRKEVGSKDNKIPTISRRGEKVWISMIYFAKKQGEGLGGNFTASELMRLWEVDPNKSGHLWADIRETFFNIVALSPSFTNNRSGKERIEWGYSYTSSYMVEGEGKETRYYYTMTPEALGITAKYIMGELTEEDIRKEGGYLQYPLKNLSLKGITESEHNFRNYLIRFKGGYSVKAYTILKDWIKLRNDLLRRRKYCYELLRKYLENAKELGLISRYDFQITSIRDWRNKWKVTIYKPTPTPKDKEKRGNNFTLRADEDELLEEIFEWQGRPVQNINMDRDKLKKQIANTIRKYGVVAINRIYEQTALGSKPSTYEFWQEVKKLKSTQTH